MPIQHIIRLFSNGVFDFLTRVFALNNSFAELGITDHLVQYLSEYAVNTGKKDVEVYKMSWKVESKYGNDLDLFIQNSSGTFSWYALQAKIMSSNGAFEDIKIKDKILQQWDKLLLHETKFGSKTYYLLYCGKSKRFPTDSPHRTDCFGVPPITELGLGVVETTEIKNIRTTLGSGSKLYFKHVFPDHIDSIRKLFCDLSSQPPSTKQFTRGEIDTSGYQLIYNDEPLQQSEDNLLKDGFAPVRVIIRNEEN